jgi:hypothetical protein
VRYVDFWDAHGRQADEPLFVGRVILDDDGTLRAEPGLSDRVTAESLLAEEAVLKMPDGRLKAVTRDYDPVRWFESLPVSFKGSYFWASTVKEG